MRSGGKDVTGIGNEITSFQIKFILCVKKRQTGSRPGLNLITL